MSGEGLRGGQGSRELKRWLATATRGVGAEAADRFAAEIEQHFLDEREELLRQGMLEVDAERQALAVLGHPKRARRELQRSHLNAWEVVRLHRLSQQPAKHIVLFRWLACRFPWRGFGSPLLLLKHGNSCSASIS